MKLVPHAGDGLHGRFALERVKHERCTVRGRASRGENGDQVQEQLESGSMFIDLGSDEHAELERLKVESAEIDAGIKLIEMGIQNWQASANQNATDAQTRAPRSGTSIQAEFSVDLAPLLTSIVEQLDQIETNSMWMAAQMAGYEPREINDVEVRRDTEFQLEDESSRISRIVSEFQEAIPMPQILKNRILVRWLEAANLVDLDEDLGGRSIRDRLEDAGEEFPRAA